MRFRVYRTSDDTHWCSPAPDAPCDGCDMEEELVEGVNPWTGEKETKRIVHYYIEIGTLEKMMEFIGGIKDHGWAGEPQIILCSDMTIEIYDDRREE